MLAYEIVTGKEPFSQNGKSATFAQFTKILFSGGRPDFPEFVTEKMKSLIQKCWSQNPTDRPSFKKIFELLSSDFSYINKKLDEDEVRDYIEELKEANGQYKSDDEKKQRNNDDDLLSSLLFDASDLEIYQKDIHKYTDIAKKKYVITSIQGIINHNDVKKFLNSVIIQGSLKHCTIMPLVGYIKPNNKFTWSFVTPYMNSINLSELIKKENKPKNWETIKAINIFGIAAGMAYMHQHDYVHTELKTKSISLDKNFYPKINCFCDLEYLKQGTMKEIPVEVKYESHLYLTPEFTTGYYSNKIDVFFFILSFYTNYLQI